MSYLDQASTFIVGAFDINWAKNMCIETVCRSKSLSSIFPRRCKEYFIEQEEMDEAANSIPSISIDAEVVHK